MFIKHIIVILTNNFSYDFFYMHFFLYVRCSQLKNNACTGNYIQEYLFAARVRAKGEIENGKKNKTINMTKIDPFNYPLLMSPISFE